MENIPDNEIYMYVYAVKVGYDVGLKLIGSFECRFNLSAPSHAYLDPSTRHIKKPGRPS